ncbi:MAG: hypothetical protein JXD23_03120 [Spirochaetales bacterium]|nr:hypothetical protein [Spirochaetales bacterium]
MRSSRIFARAFPIALAAFFIGCTTYTIVTIPPRVDLQKFNTIGVVTFDAGRERGLAKKCTQRFIEDMQGAQPGVLVLELGTRAELLKAFDKATLDADALKAIAGAKSVTGIIFAELDVAQPETEVSLKSLSLSSVRAKKSVKASLEAKLWLGDNGALAWSDSARGEWTLASASLSHVKINDPDDKYNQMVEDLAWAVTRDFRPTKEKRAVEK